MGKTGISPRVGAGAVGVTMGMISPRDPTAALTVVPGAALTPPHRDPPLPITL